MTQSKSQRVRWTLLVLLWFWAGTIFLTLDLYKNISALDAIRPDSELYRCMRMVAHERIGEPLPDDPGSPIVEQRSLAAKLELARNSDDHDTLEAIAATATDPRVRIAALESRKDPHLMLRTVRDRRETIKVRRAAARMLGIHGTEADLDAVLAMPLPSAVRDGAVLGLGELGTASATERLLERSGERAAIQAIARLKTAAAGPILCEALLERDYGADVEVAMCKALARIEGRAASRALTDVLANAEQSATVRATAANSLGRLGDKQALVVVGRARHDANPEVARQALLAHTRLSHVR